MNQEFHWEKPVAERIRNLSIVKNLKKAFSLFFFKSLKTRVAAIGPRGCNRFYSGNTGPGIRLSAQTGSTDPTFWSEHALKSSI